MAEKREQAPNSWIWQDGPAWDTEIPGSAVEVIKGQENSAEVTAWLLKNPAACADLFKLDDRGQRKFIEQVSTYVAANPEALEAGPVPLPQVAPDTTASPSVAAQAPQSLDAGQVEEAIAAHGRRMAGVVAKMPKRRAGTRLECAGHSCSPVDGLAVTQLPNSERVVLHLADHPEKARHLAQLALSNDPMTQQATFNELQRMSAGLDYGREGSTRPVRTASRAPQPIKPLGGSTVKSSIPLDEMPYQEFRARREKEAKAWRSGVRR